MSNYSDYFQLKYNPPEITQATFDAHPDGWKTTYPHKTFVDLLKRLEKMLHAAVRWINIPSGFTGHTERARAK